MIGLLHWEVSGRKQPKHSPCSATEFAWRKYGKLQKNVSQDSQCPSPNLNLAHKNFRSRMLQIRRPDQYIHFSYKACKKLEVFAEYVLPDTFIPGYPSLLLEKGLVLQRS
jgi:hypothetical protein